MYVCTNISCSLRGADEFFEAMEEAAADSIDINIRAFECLGACDIAPMASVDGEYVGPLVPTDAVQIVEDIHAEAPVLQAKQLRYRRCVDPGASGGADEFGRRLRARPPTPPASAPRTWSRTARSVGSDRGADRGAKARARRRRASRRRAGVT